MKKLLAIALVLFAANAFAADDSVQQIESTPSVSSKIGSFFGSAARNVVNLGKDFTQGVSNGFHKSDEPKVEATAAAPDTDSESKGPAMLTSLKEKVADAFKRDGAPAPIVKGKASFIRSN